MKKNLGSADRIIRLITASILALLWFQNIVTGTWGIVSLAVAVVFAATALISFCPVYFMIGLTTCSEQDSTSE